MPSEPHRAARERDPRFKLVMLLYLGVLAVTLDAIPALAALAGAGFACALAARPSARQFFLLALLLTSTVWGLMFSQALFYHTAPRTVLFVVFPPDFPLLGPLTGGLAAYREGIAHGAAQSLRLIATISAGLAFAWTTEPNRIYAGISALRLPHSLAFCAATALRFIPVTALEAQHALRAQRMRGLRLAGRGGLNAPRALLAVTRPVIVASIRRAETVALAAASRAYDPGRERTTLRPLAMTAGEKTLLLASGGLLLLAVLAKVLYLLYATGISYHPALLPLYALTPEIL